MIYELIDIKNSSGSRKKAYIIKDMESGITYTISREQILEIFRRGNSVRGLKLSRDNRILVNKGSTSQSIAPKKLSGIVVVTGNGLYSKLAKASKYLHRDSVKEILLNIKKSDGSSVILLHGIRRTGKTTAIMHTISELLKAGAKDTDIVYIEVYSTAVNISEFTDYLSSFKNKIIFIDEITKIKGFVSEAAFFSDSLTDNNVVTLAGTDSYAFNMAIIDSLHDRFEIVNFTGLKYAEYIRIFSNDLKGMRNIEKVQSFRLYGGVLSKKEYGNSMRAYISIQNAIVENIINSVMRNSTYESTQEHVKLLAKYDVKTLVHVVVRSILNTCNISRSLGTGVLKDVDMDREAYEFIDETTSNIQKYTSSELGLKENHREYVDEQHNYKGIKLVLVKAMLVALAELRVIGAIENITSSMRAEASEYYDATKSKVETLCLLPSILFCILNKMSDKLKATVEYRDKDIDGEINGILTENLVVSQCILANYDVNFLRYELTEVGLKYYGETNLTPEIDCIVTTKDRGKNRRVLIEIKHSDKPKSEHAKNLRLKSVEAIVGKDTKKLVVYRGETTEIKGIPYINIHEFLTNMKYWIEG